MTTQLARQELIIFSFYAACLQLVNTLQITTTSTIFSFLGAPSDFLPSLWMAGPVCGLIMAILAGQISDMTHSRWGKRRPYILFFGCILSISLILFPWCHVVKSAAILLCLLYISINGCMWISQAWTGDITPNNDLPKMYAFQSFFGRVGAVFSGLIMGVFTYYFDYHISTHVNIHSVPYSIKASFFFTGLVFFGGTVYIFKKCHEPLETTYLKTLEKFKFVLLKQQLKTFIFYMAENIYKPAPLIKKMCLSQFFLWYGIFCLWIYLPLAISQHYYGLPVKEIGSITTLNNAQQMALLHQGTQLTGYCYSVTQFSAIIFSLLMPYLLKKTNELKLFSLFLVIGGISLILALSTHSITILMISMLGFGLLNGSMSLLPIMAITKTLSIDKRGIGLGVFNITVTVPQLACAMSIGWIHKHIMREYASFTIILAGSFILIAGLYAVHQFCRVSKT